MTRDEILAKLKDAAGDPQSGPVAEILPTLADALADKPKREKRIIDPATSSTNTE